MFTIELDQSGNGLTIGYAGHVGPDEARRCGEEMRLALAKTQPGFRLLVDLTELQSMDVSCSPLIASMMEMCNAGGVAEVVRIIPDPTRDIGLQIMSLFHYGSDVRILTCASAAEAREAMAK
jgi:anti-anti-sigma regulatory factor